MAQITRLGVCGIPRQRYGSFAGKSSGPAPSAGGAFKPIYRHRRGR